MTLSGGLDVRNNRIRLCVFSAAILISTTGCWFGTGSTSDVRDEVTRQMGVELEPEFGMKLGRFSTALAKPIVKMAMDDPIPLKGIAKVEIGVYNVVPARADAAAFDPVAIGSLDFPDWQPIVRVREGGERVQVLVQPDGDKIRGMLVLVLDDEEFVVVRVRGKLHKVIPRLLEMDGWTGVYSGFDDVG